MLNPSKIKSNLESVIQEAELNDQNFVNSPGRDMTRKRACPFIDTVNAILSFAKLNEKLFPYLFNRFNASFHFKKKIKGLHIFAVDGSDSNLPTDRRDLTYFIPFKGDPEGCGYWQIQN